MTGLLGSCLLVCSRFSAWPLLDGRSPRYWALVVACTFVLAAAFAPWTLRSLNALWTRFGALLHRIVTPIVICLTFVGAVIPCTYYARAWERPATPQA